MITYRGPKARIAVASFRCKAAKCSGAIGDGLADMLATALFRTGRFIVLERGEGLKAIQEELNLAQSGYVRQGAGPKTGLMEGADILVIGAITAFEPNASGVGGGGIVVPFNIPLIGGAKISKKEAYIAADIRLVDVRTGRVINATSVEGKATSWKVGGGMGTILGTVALGGALGAYKNTPMEKAIRVMLYNAVDAIAKMVPENYYRWGSDTQGYNNPSAAPRPAATSAPRDSSVAPAPTGGLVRPEARFEPGKKVVWQEDFSRCTEVPSSIRIVKGTAECVSFQGKKWLATIKGETVFYKNLQRFRWSGDWAIEYTFYCGTYVPHGQASVRLGRFDAPFYLYLAKGATAQDTSFKWMNKPIPLDQDIVGRPHRVALQKKGDTIRIFFDGKKLLSDRADPLALDRLPSALYFILGSGYADIETGRYVLLTDIRVTSY
ncbi:CsgG/HfaB family protein [Thermosulfurimonas sp. F29]|uniref:CsgG/HfaB family protein n=1 Tax=Thermosulfurimonas sp. F29 TaxID=2867247 RepID=UPI001C83F532|nr:CsgG/HfaB family protein [Thermosulfurimonas sp. F29]MBX6422482.1 CsgG/HfaB family protein [Thermosulfurimonas sp. F29]